MTGAADDLLSRGWAALTATDWDEARSCFEQARAEDESAEALDGLGRALHFQGEYAEAIEQTERAFAAYREAGRALEAADRARWLAFLHGAINCNMAAASGWMSRAEELLEAEDECAGHGWIAIDWAPFADDPADRERLAASALAIARRYGDVDLEFDALAQLGEAYVASGRTAEGMKLLDQAMTAVSSGEVSAVVPVGDIVCRLLSACEMALDLARAEEWMLVANRFEAWSEWVSPVCRSHYGGLLVAVGRWPEAEENLVAALRTFERSYRLMRGAPLVKLADLRLRQGRLEEAARLLEGNESSPAARRIAAAIALVRGELALAEDMARLCLEGEGPPDPACAPALDLLVQIRLARGDDAGASDAVAQLHDVASETEDGRAAAFAELAAGRVAAHDGGEVASAHLQTALRRFAELELPLEAARAQLELARAMAGAAPAAAVVEARAALRVFERIGAAGDANAAGALLRELGGGGRAAPRRYGELTKRESEVLALLAEGCSNADIAERLVISKRTAEHHVASILSKLDLRSRAEAAAYAVRELARDT